MKWLACGLVVIALAACQAEEGPQVGWRSTSPAPTASPAPSPVAYDLPPDGQIMARAAFFDMSAEERAGMCSFMGSHRRDAIRQAVDAGFPPAVARDLVAFIRGELCP